MKSKYSSYFDPIIMAPAWQKYVALIIISVLVLYIPITQAYQQWCLLHNAYQQNVSQQHGLSQLRNRYHVLKNTFPTKISHSSHTVITEYFLHQKIHILQMQWEPDAPYLTLSVKTNYQNLMLFIQTIQQRFPLLRLEQLNMHKNLIENQGVKNGLTIKMVWRLTT